MKRKILISTLLLLTGLVTHAQDLDIKPSQQAQGILESKNAMVDHATGLFHYKVPLYEIKSGNFTLPISLDYVAKGVKVQDKPGLIGYNWTLNTGGVVTRTIRGGIADEELNGFPGTNLGGSIPSTSQIEEINNRIKDGESDIFTASFNGQTVNFFLKLTNGDYSVETLDPTNVKIEIINKNAYSDHKIDGWIIIDEYGNKYTFTQKEWSANIVQEKVVSDNSIVDLTYISSWYLTKIEPVNMSPIKYEYLADVDINNENQPDINAYNYYHTSFINYSYGNKIIDKPFDFIKYKETFDSYMHQAKNYVSDAYLNQQAYNSMFNFGTLYYFYENVANLQVNSRIMGIFGNLEHISTASNELISALNNLISAISHNAYYDDHNIRMAISYIDAAKSEVNRCLAEKCEVSSKEQMYSNVLRIKSPLLKTISYNDKIIQFDYNYYYDFKKLSNIIISDIYKNVIKTIKLNNANKFEKISFTGSDNKEYDYLKFNYYDKDTNDINLMADIFGYYKKSYEDSGFKYAPNVDGNVKYLSLESIETSNKLNIKLVYESNEVHNKYHNSSIADLFPLFGGIRINSIKITDNVAQVFDVIKYRYPIKGNYIYPKFTNYIRLDYQYTDNPDYLTYSKIVNLGTAYIKYGNNGVYYPYVEEEYIGKGTIGYNFYFPVENVQQNQDTYFPYWSIGLPLSKTYYDANNRLNKLITYSYNENNEYARYTSGNTKFLRQIKPYEYYVNSVKVENYYRNMGTINFPNGPVNPYDAIYLPNVQSRTYPVLPDKQYYDIMYNVDAYLNEITEYNFENQPPTEPSSSDNLKRSSNFTKIKYTYGDLSISRFPIKTTKINSDGTGNIETTKRVIDFDESVDEMIALLKHKNMVNAVVKIQNKVVKQDNRDQFVNEKIYKYGSHNVNNIDFITLDEVYHYDNNLVENEESNGLFSFEKSKYHIDKILYKYNIGNYLPTYQKGKDLESIMNYDFANTNVIFKANNVTNNTTASYDFNRYDNSLTIPYFAILLKDFYHKYLQINRSNLTPNVLSFMKSAVHADVINFIERITSGNCTYSELTSLINQFYSNTHLDNFFQIYDSLSKEVNSELYNIFLGYNFLETCEITKSSLIEMTEEAFSGLFLIKNEDIVKKPTHINVNSITNNNYKAFVLYCGNNNSTIVCHINTSQGTILKNFVLNPSNVLNIINIDVREYGIVNSIDLFYTNNVKYLALTPGDAEFEAVSYNSDGTVFCKFNQNGQLERYEYDAAGRVVKVYDNDNNVLKEFKYNVVL